MSILDFPRLHFQGSARIHAPTGHKYGNVDVGSNVVYMDGKPVDSGLASSEYHKYLYNLGFRFNEKGQEDENGAFSMATGWNFGGNGHFSIDAQIISTQRAFGEVDKDDPMVGRCVDLWGHYNDYVKTTCNRARFFECDPASNWTDTIMLGQLSFGRVGGSHEVGYMVSAPITGMQLARWQNFNYIYDLPAHCLNKQFQRAAVFQFAIPKDVEGFLWDDVALSPTVSMLQDAMSRDDVLGLVVQFSISNMSAPVQPDSPTFWELHGTIGLWCKDELRTYPHGRLLTPCHLDKSQKSLSNLALQVTPQGVSLNMITAIPGVGRQVLPEKGLIHSINSKLDLGDLELRTINSQVLIARIPRQAYQLEAHNLTSGIIDVNIECELGAQIQDEGLCLVGYDANNQKKILLTEQEINLQVDDACLFIEHPNWKSGEDHAVELEVRSFARGRPASVSLYLRQFYNPKAFPQLKYEFESFADAEKTFEFPCSSSLPIVNFKNENGEFVPNGEISTDFNGFGKVTLRGARSGTAKILLSVNALELGDDAEIAYDNDDNLNFWAGAGFFAVRVLGNDWHLEDIPDKEVDFNLIYKHILAFYEFCFSFMKVDVFSLADQCKVETYARLMWQMSDPKNKCKTYYMPPSRDMSQAKTNLLRKFLQNQQRIGYIPPVQSTPKQIQCSIQTRSELVAALRHAAELEVTVMLQYIYAGYSVPNYVTGEEYVRRGLWTSKQLQLACGDGKEAHNYGMRGVLIEISREEMIHFLMVNNILMAIGEPFYPAVPNWSTLNARFPIDVDFALEPLNASSLQLFVHLEKPDFLETSPPTPLLQAEGGKCTASSLVGKGVGGLDLKLHNYGSLSELYHQIREALQNIPDLFVVQKGCTGGEHRLFMRDDFNRKHPDYQMQVDDLNSALFAIDLIVEQGEGSYKESQSFENSHYQKFRRLADSLASEQMYDPETGCKVPWNPSYPALRNPSLYHRDYSTNVVTVPETRAVMEIFNESYFLMMQLMVQHFGMAPKSSLRRSKLMNAGIDVMTGMMRPLGELLMSLPSGKRGKTAGPSFEIDTPAYISAPEIAMTMISRRFEQLGDKAREYEVVPNTVCEMFEFYTKFFADLASEYA
jgi:chromopyrrolic acid synthase